MRGGAEIMKKIFPIILSSILAISATTNNASANLLHDVHSGLMAGLGAAAQKISGKALSLDVIKYTMEQFKTLPAESYQLMGEEFKDAKPIILQCLKDRNEITVLSFTYCCEQALDTSYSSRCRDMLQTAIAEHNKRIEYLAPCTPEGKGNATAGRYVYINGIKVCAATHCQADSYLVRNSKGQSQGWCKVGVDPHSGPISDEIDLSSLALIPTAGLPKDDLSAQITATSERILAQQTLSPEAQKQLEKQQKTQNKIEALENEKTCLAMGVKSANIAEMNACKKDPEAYKTEQDNENACLNQGLRRATTAFAQCKKDPSAYQTCMTFPGIEQAEITSCMAAPQSFNEKKIAKKQNENQCMTLGATSGTLKNLCMNNPDDYASKKSECEGMGATDNDLNKCIRDVNKYRTDWQIAQKAQELGINERNAKKYMENEAEINRLKALTGQV